ncbi:MAG: hypothetical protein EBQ89_04090 [Alphaproteobacteria bacterium]|nr:hypothetical protein [Alphaproteobacteria bacterium]
MKVAVICGLKAEADCWKRSPLRPEIYISSSRPFVTRQIVQAALAHGAEVLISFGIAGGLHPTLKTGQLLWPHTIKAAHGEWRCDMDCAAKLFTIPACATHEPIYGSDKMVTSVEEKKKLLTATGCAAVDMESHIVAEAASAAHIPFFAMRAVCDVAHDPLPAIAQLPLNDNGQPSLRDVVRLILSRPATVVEAVNMGMNFSAALRKLRGIF